jgi:glutathione S-transferase
MGQKSFGPPALMGDYTCGNRNHQGADMSRSLKLWSFADVDRSGKVRWAARELGYDIEEQRVGLGEHAAEPYRALNPYAQIPTAEIDGQRLIESTAICLALAERHPEAALVPQDRDLRDRFWQALNLATTTFESPVVLYYLARRGVIDAAWAPLCEAPLRRRLPVFAAGLPDDGYICGSFTLADVCAAYVLRIAVQAELLPLEGVLAAYLRRLAARPAAQEARFFEGLNT